MTRNTNDNNVTPRVLDMSAAGDPPMKPTDEQRFIQTLFDTRDSLVVEAGAGTGKTSTLKMLAESTRLRGQYVAFNRGIVNEAKAKFPHNVTCSTAHSLAFRSQGAPFGSRLRSSKRMRSGDLARAIGIMQGVTIGDKRIAPSLLGSIASRTVQKFCQSADEELSVRHVPYQDGLDYPAPDGIRTYDNNNELAQLILPYARRVWEDATDVHGSLPYQHAYYLKMWELNDPVIPADFILFDEAQDASPVLISAVQKQRGAQIVWVGDSNQQIYEFTGAVNAMARVDVKARAMLTQSFRFGDAIADVANGVLARAGSDMRLKGLPSIESRVGTVDEPDAVLTRTNALSVSEYLTYRQEGRKPYIVGGGDQIVRFARAAQDLMDKGWTGHPELACFSSWAEVQTYVKEDAQGDDLRLLVNLIDEFGVQVVLSELGDMVPERQADLIISTAHKSKGLEWDRVVLSSDFTLSPDTSPSELRLLYVAVTRSRRELDAYVITGDV